MRLKFRPDAAATKQRTLRDFSGGLNTQDSPWNMSSHYATELINMFVGDDGSLSVRPPFTAFANAHKTIGSSGSTAVEDDWGKYNESIVAGAAPTISTTNGTKWITIDFDAPHGLVTGNWVSGVSTLTTGNLGGVPYAEFNDSQWRCVKKISDNVIAVRCDTEATSTTSTALITETRYCNKVALMLPQGAEQNEASLGFVDGRYFNNRLILVDRVGVVYSVDGTGDISILFNDVIAETVSGSPRGWRPLCNNGPLIDLLSFVAYKGTLSIHNGLDKPLEVYDDSGALKCRYLTDAGTGLNLFTPVGALATVSNQYVCVAGQPLNPACVSIGARGTNGTFVGDPDPNDATEIYVDEYSESDTSRVTGLGTYRGRLLIYTPNAVLVFELGAYVEDVHQPRYIETLYDFGTRSPRSLAQLNDDLLVLDEAGLVGVRQTKVSNSLEVNRYSDVVRDRLLELLELSDSQFLYSDAFARIDRKSRSLITRLKRSDDVLQINVDTVLRQKQNSSACKLELSRPTAIRVGDTITLFDFADQNNISLSGGGGNYRQYRIKSVSEDRLNIYFDARTNATTTGVYIPTIGFAALVLTSSSEESFVREAKDAIYSFRMIPGSKILAWQELAGLDRFGSLRTMITTELNNLFAVYDYHIFYQQPQTTTTYYDADRHVGQNVHASALITGGVRRYHALIPVFDPSEASDSLAPKEHRSVAAPGTLSQDLAALGETWPLFTGNPIEFVYESPWIDFNNRRTEKACRYIALDTEGSGTFTLQAFADGVYKDEFGNFLPVAQMTFWGGSKKYHQSTRGGSLITVIEANTNIFASTIISDNILEEEAINAYSDNQQLHPFDVRFRTIRFRIFGDTTYGPLRIVSVSLYSADGALIGA